MPYIFGKLWHLAIIWAIRKAFQCILQGVRILLANHTQISPTSENDSYRDGMWTFWPIFSIKISIFDTQNTFYLIVRDLKNAFFMSLTHLLCRYPTILWKSNKKQLGEMGIYVVEGWGGFNPYGQPDCEKSVFFWRLPLVVGSKNTFMWGKALELSSQAHALCKISTPAATTVQPTGPGRLTGKTAHNDPCLLFPQSRVCKTFLLAARVHPSIWSYFCS